MEERHKKKIKDTIIPLIFHDVHKQRIIAEYEEKNRQDAKDRKVQKFINSFIDQNSHI